MTRKLTFLILALFALISGPGAKAWGQTKTSTLTFTAACNGSGIADDDVTWTVTSDAAESNYDATKGIHYGTSSKAVSYLTLTSAAFNESYKITKVVVNCSDANKTAMISVTVGGENFGTSQMETAYNNSAYTFEPTTAQGSNFSGVVVVSMSRTSVKKALYVKSIQVTYNDGQGADHVLQSLAVSGTPNKMTYETGEEFNPAGLIVTGTYDDATTEDLTDDAEWTFNPATFTSTSQNSVSVTATVDGITSPAYTVNGLTVNEHIVTPGTYTLGTDWNSLFGTNHSGSFILSANSLNLNGTSNDITLNVTNGQSTNGYIKTGDFRWYNGYTLTFTVPQGYVITNITFTEGGKTPENLTTETGSFNYNQQTSESTWNGSSQAVTFTATGTGGVSNIQVTFINASSQKFQVFYNGNGNDSGTVPTDNNEYDENDEVTVLGSGSLTKEHYYFYCWSDKVDGNSEGANLYEEDDKFNIQANTTLFAQWLANEHSLTLNYSSEDENASVGVNYGGTSKLDENGDNAQVGYGTEVEITTTFNSGYICNITVTDANSNVIQLTNNKFNMPDNDVTVTISIIENPYIIDIITAADLAATETVYIDFSNVTKTSHAVYAGNSAKNNSANIQMRSNNSNSGIISTSTGGKVKSVRITVASGSNTIDVYGKNTPYNAASDLYNSQKQGTKIGSLQETGTITFHEDYAYVGIRSYSGAIYLSSIEISWEETKINDIVEINDAQTLTGYITIGENGMIDIQDSGILTIQGTLICNDADQILIEDGGQLITSSTGVKATVLKSITGYSDEASRDGYYLIANPTNVATVAHLNDNNYDLYTFNPAGDGYGNEWINMKSSPAVANGTGYLYANSSDVTLEFAGELTPASEIEVTLVKATAGTGIDFPGFNLIGNPFACNAYPTYENGNFMPFYKTNGTGSELTLVEDVEAIAPCEGFFVEAATTGQSVTISTTAPTEPAKMMSLNVSNESNVGTIDRAIVNFDGRNNLHKFMLNPDHTNISLAMNGEEFAAVSTSSTSSELPVNFKAEKNGTYTITVNTENIDAEYLHLIDNMTGMDVDLLASTGSASYTFEAKTSDYASRFKLVFNVNNAASASSDSNFAYMSDGNLVISDIEGEATLQIIDMMGRVVSTETVSGNYSKALNLRAGAYVLNLNGMTQKIVVK